MATRPRAAIPLPRRSAVEQALHQLVQNSDSRLESMLVIPAQFARSCLRADSVELARWHNRELHTLTHIGDRDSASVDRPAVRTSLANHPDWSGEFPEPLPELLEYPEQKFLLQLPISIADKAWGRLRLWRKDSPFSPDDLSIAVEVLEDLSGMVGAAERLQRMARQALEDPLTGLHNRRAFTEDLAKRLEPGNVGATVIMSDINRLKFINDRYGHLAGDRVIVDTAQALTAAAAQLNDPNPVIARLGGDEFAVLLSGADRAGAIALITEASRRLGESTYDLTISSGIAVAPAGFSITQALALADEAQYAAKSRGALLIVAATGVDTALAERQEPLGHHSPAADRDPEPKPPRESTDPQALRNILVEVGHRLAEPPLGVGATLRWLGERLLLPFDLAEWAVSRVNLTGDRLVTTDSMGINGSVVGPERYDDQVDSTFPVDDYPLTLAAISDRGWFAVNRDHPLADPAERAVLEVMGMTQLVAIGSHIGTQGWLLELYGRGSHRDEQELGNLLAVALSSLLQQPFRQLTTTPDARGPGD